MKQLNFKFSERTDSDDAGQAPEPIQSHQLGISFNFSMLEGERPGQVHMICTSRVLQGNGRENVETEMPSESPDVTGLTPHQIAEKKKDYGARVALSFFGPPRPAAKKGPSIILPNQGIIR